MHVSLYMYMCESKSLVLLKSTHTFNCILAILVGLQYAEEVGVENDPSPSYRCTVCSTSTVGGNQALHFTSTAHRMNVLVRYSLSHQKIFEGK